MYTEVISYNLGFRKIDLILLRIWGGGFRAPHRRHGILEVHEVHRILGGSV